MRTGAAAGEWQETGGQGQAVAQQSPEVSQQAEAQASAVGTDWTAAGDSGAVAKLESRRSKTFSLISPI